MSQIKNKFHHYTSWIANKKMSLNLLKTFILFVFIMLGMYTFPDAMAGGAGASVPGQTGAGPSSSSGTTSAPQNTGDQNPYLTPDGKFVGLPQSTQSATPTRETEITYESFTEFPGLGVISNLCELTQGLWYLGFIVLFISVLAALVYGAFMYTSAGVNAGKVNKAKEVIGNAVIGLVIGLSVVIVIQVINPGLLTSTCEIQDIQQVGDAEFAAERIGGGTDNLPGGQGPGPGEPGGQGGPIVTPEGSFASGLFTGPASTIGSGTEYHIDTKLPNTTSWEQIDAYFLSMAQGYAANGRKIEFSNAAVSGEVYNPNASQSERIALLRRAAAAHAPRSGLHSFDYYIPTTNTNRFSSSVENVEMILPSVPGGRVEYGSGGRYGNYVRVYDASGNFVYTTGHGNDTRTLPSNRSF